MMTSPPLLFLLLLLLLRAGGGHGSSPLCPAPCSCQDGGLVDCSRRDLAAASLPARFPPDTVRLRLHDNRLGFLPGGALDGLPRLRSVSLHGNPWACDCGVLYLRAWLLLRWPAGERLNVTCSSPPGLRGRRVMYLGEEEVLGSCRYWYCDLAMATQACLGVLVLAQALLLVAVVTFLRRFEALAGEARRTARES